MNAFRRLTFALKGGDEKPKMGQNHTRESGRGSRAPGSHDLLGGHSTGGAHRGDQPERSRRTSRADLSSLLGGNASSSRNQQSQDAPFERRETRAEREARKLEKERVARVKERERSMKEEHVDGGYLVTMGIYTASEDFNKPIVRQLQIERRLAPFWRGLDDIAPNWAEHQIIAAARGLEIPPADVVPEGLVPQPPQHADSPSTSQPNLNNLTVPMGPRTLSAASDKSGSNPGSSLPSPTSPGPPRTNSGGLIQQKKKALAAALSISPRNGSQQDIGPRELNLPADPFVNGQPLEVFLYKDDIECPICCMQYPRYLNKTRCCDQFICSECFVQIKRPDPHLPEHHEEQQNGPENPAPNSNPEDVVNPDELVSEPACCPFCKQPDFGVTYEPPPFRRGLTYTFGPPGLGSMSTAMSSTSSLNSSLSPTSATTPLQAGRRRTQSLLVNAPGVISIDRIRPDWSTKLANARNQQRRRAAAADALHHAAFVIGNNDMSARTLFSRTGRFSRRNTSDNTRTAGNESPSGSAANHDQGQEGSHPGIEPGPRSSSGRTGPSRERIDAAHLESMMMAEAIRLSLADEEERRKKADKEAKKEAKKKEKEEKKANKRKSIVYGEGASSASASSLSLGLGGFGRKRGNSLRMEASVAAAGLASGAGSSATQSHESISGTDPPRSIPEGVSTDDKGKGVDRGGSTDTLSQQSSNSNLPVPVQPTRGSSHLRQMSNASSVSSASGIEGFDPRHHDPHANGLNQGRSEDDEASGTEGASRTTPGQASVAESMFNFFSLASMVGVPIDGQTAEGDGTGSNSKEQDNEAQEHVEHAPEENEASQAKPDEAPTPPPEIDTHNSPPPELTITHETPAPLADEEKSKQLSLEQSSSGGADEPSKNT